MVRQISKVSRITKAKLTKIKVLTKPLKIQTLISKLTRLKVSSKFPKFLQLIPWIPVGLEMLTGQKIPATGVLADILSGISQLQISVNQILTQQQQIWNKLVNLENNASNQLTNLSQQVANTKQDFRIFVLKLERV